MLIVFADELPSSQLVAFAVGLNTTSDLTIAGFGFSVNKAIPLLEAAEPPTRNPVFLFFFTSINNLYLYFVLALPPSIA